jgi:anti-anti-sigma regulatory factor
MNCKAGDPVHLSGPMTLQTVTEAHEKILEAFTAEAVPTLDISEVEDPDLCFIQLIESARRTARERGQVLTLSSPAPEAMMRALERGGFVNGSDERRNFWLAK